MAHPDARPSFAYYQDVLAGQLRNHIAAFGNGGPWAQATPETTVVSPAVAAEQYRQLQTLVSKHGEAAVAASFGAVIGGMGEVMVAAAVHAGVTPTAMEFVAPVLEPQAYVEAFAAGTIPLAASLDNGEFQGVA